MPTFRTLDALEPEGKVVLVRLDLNVPMKEGEVTDATRIERSMPTVRELIDRKAKVIILSHLGRPKGRREPSMSLKPLIGPIKEALGGKEVAFAEDCVGEPAKQAVDRLRSGEAVLFENLRFHAGEEKNDPALSDRLASLGDVYVNDAFSGSHRAHASVVGLAERLPSYAGRLMQAELGALEKALETPERPVAALVGGAKVSTKLDLLGNLIEKADVLVLGGGMANTFLLARGTPIGKSLCEREMLDTAKEIMAKATAESCEILLPSDVRVAKELKEGAAAREIAAEEVADDDMILDIGPASAKAISARLAECRTAVWNGPLGAFEIRPFDAGTSAVAKEVARLTQSGRLLSVAGGGDTLSALRRAGVLDQLSYASTAGGAFLEWLEGKELPGVAALARR
jgi:phosphoglycerate kinase